MFGIKNGVIALEGDTMDYIRFGRGRKSLVMLPGLGDGLVTVKGKALAMAFLYRAFSREYTVFMFSRKNHLPAGATTRDMAHDLKKEMDILGIDRADLVGVSMGGMIAQHFCIDYPEKVNKLALVVTCAEPNPVLTESVNDWISLARAGDHAAFMDSNLRRIYSDAYYRKNKWLVPVIGKLTKPKSYERFLIQANACLTHDASGGLHKIQAPALIIGGEKDCALGAEASRALAAKIPGAKIRMYPEWGHGLYEEAKDFQKAILDFLRN
ncbi:MAG: alpha/beta hydrolase [Clostridia bacterium]|nr:alpha/beta hydrolase [Clostridia bacterium]